MPTTCFFHQYNYGIPLDATTYIVQGPADVFAFGSINVTAFAIEEVAVGGIATRALEVIQMGTRREPRTGGYNAFLDIVVRNNGHVGSGANPISAFVTYTSVITP